jgi:hypothetical protein
VFWHFVAKRLTPSVQEITAWVCLAVRVSVKRFRAELGGMVTATAVSTPETMAGSASRPGFRAELNWMPPSAVVTPSHRLPIEFVSQHLGLPEGDRLLVLRQLAAANSMADYIYLIHPLAT